MATESNTSRDELEAMFLDFGFCFYKYEEVNK